MIVTDGDALPRQAQGRIGDSCVALRYVALRRLKHFLTDVSDVADQTGTVRGPIERVMMSLKPGFYMIVTLIVSIMSPTDRGHVAYLLQLVADCYDHVEIRL